MLHTAKKTKFDFEFIILRDEMKKEDVNNDRGIAFNSGYVLEGIILLTKFGL